MEIAGLIAGTATSVLTYAAIGVPACILLCFWQTLILIGFDQTPEVCLGGPKMSDHDAKWEKARNARLYKLSLYSFIVALGAGATCR